MPLENTATTIVRRGSTYDDNEEIEYTADEDATMALMLVSRLNEARATGLLCDLIIRSRNIFWKAHRAAVCVAGNWFSQACLALVEAVSLEEVAAWKIGRNLREHNISVENPGTLFGTVQRNWDLLRDMESVRNVLIEEFLGHIDSFARYPGFEPLLAALPELAAYLPPENPGQARRSLTRTNASDGLEGTLCAENYTCRQGLKLFSPNYP
ncbi:hypothetical protein MMC25_005763 [Agyrium rufum]|nr:hypothetical protein [Agyrium rufum]